MWFLHRLSLRARLAALVAVVAVVVLTTGALALYQDLSSEVSDAITAELEVRLADMAGNLSSAVPVGPGPLIAQTVDARGAVLAPAGAPPLLTAAELAAALRQQVRVDREVPGVGRHARLLAHPIGTVGGQPVIGVAATTTTALERARRRLVLVLGVAGPALTSAITLTAWLLAGAALRPVRRMAREAGTISMAQPGRRLPQPGGRDEIAELGRTLNQMLARIEATVAHERAFIDDASHELRTPIAVLRGELELAAQDPVDAGAVADGLRSALEETDRLGALTEDLLTLARADAGQLQVGSARTDVLDAARTAAEHVSRPDGVVVEVRGGPAAVRAEPDWIGQILTNLLGNATRYARRRIVIDVSTSGSDVRLAVADDGPGFPEELLPRVFDRFVRGDGTRGPGGAGLGLSIVASLARALSGDVSAGNGPPAGGARVEVTLPRAEM